jgi:hypothetical protein
LRSGDNPHQRTATYTRCDPEPLEQAEMNTEEALTAFATVIIVISVIAVVAFALAKITQYQRSRGARSAFAPPDEPPDSRTQWSDDAFGVPTPPPLTGDNDAAAAPAAEAVVVNYSEPVPVVEPEPAPAPPLPPPPLPVPPPPPPPIVEDTRSEPAPAEPPPAPPAPVAADPAPPAGELSGEHWVLGSSPFLPTPRGGTPSAAAIERRFWQNLATGHSAELLGPENLSRLAEGKPPLRVNRRTGRTEALQTPPLNAPGDEERAPRWPSQANDPFANAQT